LTNSEAVELASAWSPDGERVLYRSNRDNNWDIYSMNADGSDSRRLTDDPESDSDPTYSRDGKKIAFRTYREGHWQLYLMNPDGSGQANLSKSAVDEYYYWWSPDGTRIYILSASGPDMNSLTWHADLVAVADGSRTPIATGFGVSWR
jgi:Tol biopolymer transport system component